MSRRDLSSVQTPRPRRRARTGRPTGGIYVAVMAAVLVVTLIGMSAVLAARIERRASTADDDAVRARFVARSFAEIVLQRLQGDETWRSRYAHANWSPVEQVDGAKAAFRVADEADADLADDSSEPFRTQTRATYGSATRSISMSVQPPPAGSGGVAPNRIDNGGMELFSVATSPPTRWYHHPSGPAEISTLYPRVGARLCRIYARSSPAAGLSQDLPVTAIRKGVSYDVRAWVKYSGLVNARAGLILTDSTGTVSRFQVSKLTVNGAWVELTGTVTPTWTGTLTNARFHIDTATGVGDLRVDDVAFTERRLTGTLSVVSGSVRREVAE